MHLGGPPATGEAVGVWSGRRAGLGDGGVDADYARAIALHRRQRLLREGQTRSYGLRVGEYVDCVVMARWRRPGTLS